MRPRIGLAVAHDAVRAVAVTRRGLVWAAEAPITPGRSLEAAIDTVLGEIPLRRWQRPVLSAAVGPGASQVKLVAGLPEINDVETLTAIVRESAASLFLKNGVPLLTTGVRPAGAGIAWAAALDQPCVAAVRDACRARGWRLGMIAPAAIALPLGLEDPSFTWVDGDIVLEINRAEGTLRSVRTRPACAIDHPATTLHPSPALSALGDRAARYADAYGAARLDWAEVLALDPAAAGWWSGPQARRRFVLPSTLSLVAIASLALSPLGTRWAEQQAAARGDRVQPDQWRAIDSALAQLDHVTEVLGAANAFAASRPNLTALLAQIARVLPQGAALASFELNRDTAQAIILTARPATVLAAVKGLSGLTGADLLPGPAATAAPIGGSGLQRIVLRFDLHLPRNVPSAGASR